jgi:uncharacterized membrane protein YvbJ
MALVECPSCNKRVSDKAEQCPHCEFKLSGLTSDQLNRELERALHAKKDKILSQSMLALLLAIAAFTYFFIQQPHPDSWQAQSAYAGMIIGLIWFVVNRVRLVFLKRKRH